MSARPVGYLLFALIFILCRSAMADESQVRRMPFPFDHMLTIASDVDQTAPWHGHAIYDFLNTKLGLPIASSVWVQGNSPEASSFFKSYQALNKLPSGVNNLPVYALLLRDWHRGGLDHFHSWQDDAPMGLKKDFEKPVRLDSETVVLPIDEIPVELETLPYQNLRIVFDRVPPGDLAIVAKDATGKKASANFIAFRHSAAIFKSTSWKGVEVIFDPAAASAIDGIVIEPGFLLGKLREITLYAKSCVNACAASVTRVERDVFSRQNAAAQTNWLEAWNIRPLIYTSHGGYTFSQNYWSDDEPNFELPKQGNIFGSKYVLTSLRGLLNDSSSFGFMADLLQRLGVEYIWPYSRQTDYNWNQPHPSPQSLGPFRLYSRTRGPEFPTDTLQRFRTSIELQLPGVDAQTVENAYCPKVCWNDQGSMLAIPLLAAFNWMQQGGLVDQIVYTHLASGDADWRRTKQQPLKESVVVQLKELARHYYDFDGNIASGQRVWVPPASSEARYRTLLEQIGEHIDIAANDISIVPWKDKFTGRIVPDLSAGTRDLHGLTVYVADPSKTKIRVGDRVIASFVRNVADRTGRASVTIVDDHLPTVIAGLLPLERLGAVSTSRAVMQDSEWPAVGRTNVASGLRIDLPAGGAGYVAVRPRDLVLDNITHFRLRYRHSDGSIATGRLLVEMKFDAGHRVTIAEGRGAQPPAGAQTGWWINMPAGSSLAEHLLPLAGLQWSGLSERLLPLPLPLGRVTEIRIGMIEASPGEAIEVEEFTALRPSGNSIDPDGKVLLSGRVTLEGEPEARIPLRLVAVDGSVRETETDSDGLYYFPNLSSGVPIYVAAKRLSNVYCAPQGATVRAGMQDDVLADVELSTCVAPPAEWQNSFLTR